MEDFGIGIYQISMAAFPATRILYVGQSKYLSERMADHRKLLKNGKHHNLYLQNVYNKHGLSGWKFSVLENCKLDELDDREQFYIDFLKPECNIVRDIKNFGGKYVKIQEQEIESVLVAFDLPGLELDWRPKPWHRQVYGAG